MDYSISDSPEWKKFTANELFSGYSRTIDSVNCVRASVIFSYSILDIFRVLCLHRNRVEESLEHHDILGVTSATTTLEYTKYKAVWPTSSRDFLTVTHWRILENGSFVILSYSKENDSLCPAVNECVRGDMKIGGYLIEPIDDKSSRVTYLLQVQKKRRSRTHV